MGCRATVARRTAPFRERQAERHSPVRDGFALFMAFGGRLNEGKVTALPPAPADGRSPSLLP
ncbi:hypothetical protein GCM10010341_80670 [Streptomyces noursei]|nr:hypothetical protein GCM10010341_80670 [Streptomyces noursei]